MTSGVTAPVAVGADRVAENPRQAPCGSDPRPQCEASSADDSLSCGNGLPIREYQGDRRRLRLTPTATSAATALTHPFHIRGCAPLDPRSWTPRSAPSLSTDRSTGPLVQPGGAMQMLMGRVRRSLRGVTPRG